MDAAALRFRLWWGRSWWRLRRSLAKRNLTTLTGFAAGGLSVLATVLIIGIPTYYKIQALPGALAVVAVGAAYVYQAGFKIYRSRKVDDEARRHDLNRKLTEARIIRDIHERLIAQKTLGRDRLLIETVLGALVSKVAEKVGGHSQMGKLQANLMVPHSTDATRLVVIARFGTTRVVPAEYPMAERFCAGVWSAPARSLVAGNIKTRFPERARGVPYCDILCIPVLDLGGAVIACVNVDSAEPHHFPHDDEKIRGIEIEIAPYIAMLRMVLTL